MTTPDDPAYENQPQHWNSSHVVTIDAVGSEIIGAFDNAGNVKFGLAAGSISASAGIKFSAGTLSQIRSDFTFSNANGVTFGLETNGVVTASVAAGGAFSGGVSTGGNSAGDTGVTGTRLVFAGGANITLSQATDANGATISVAGGAGGGGNFSAGVSNIGNTSGDTGITGTRLVFVGGNNVTLSQATDANGASVTISGANTVAQSVQPVAASGSNGSFAFSTLSLGSSNGMHFYTTNGSIVGSYTVPTQSNQTGGIYALGNTTGQSSSSTYDLRTLSIEGAGFISVGWSNGSFRISGTQTNPVVSNAIQSVGSATGSGTNTSRFAADDHVHAGVFSMGVSTGGNIAGDTRVDVGRFVFAGGANITLSQATAAGALNTISIVGANQSNQTIGFYAVGNTTQNSSTTLDARTVSFGGRGGITVGYSNGTIQISGSQSVQTQPISIFATSNTTQSSSGTSPANSLLFVGAGIASVGYSNGSVIISVPSGGGGGDGGVFFGVSTFGNTAGSTGTVSTGNVVLVGSGAISLSQSTGAAGSAATITINAPATSSLVGTSGISISTAGSTISVYEVPVSYYEPAFRGATSTLTLNPGTVYIQPFVVAQNMSAYRMHLLQQITTQATLTQSFTGRVSASAGSSGGTGQAGYSGTIILFSRKSTGTAAESSQIVSFYSNTYSHQLNMFMTGSNSTNASSATLRWTTSAEISFISSVGSNGGVTTGSFGSSSSGSFTSTSTNGNSFSSNAGTMSFGSQVLSGVRPVLIPLATVLTPGEYWLGHIISSSSASSTYSLQRLLNFGGASGFVHYSTNTEGFKRIGSTASMNSSNVMGGWGSYSASSQTTTTIPLSQISNMSNLQTWFNMMAAIS
jgi:hypothetical protein